MTSDTDRYRQISRADTTRQRVATYVEQHRSDTIGSLTCHVRQGQAPWAKVTGMIPMVDGAVASSAVGRGPG